MLKHSAHSEGLSMLLATYIQLQAHCWCDSFGYFSTRPKRSFWLHCDVQTSLFRAMALPLFLLIASSMRVTSTAKACALVQMLISMFVRLFTDARSVLLVLLVSLLFRTSVPISTANSFHVSSRSSCPAFLHPTYISCLLLNCWPMLLVCLNVHATTWPSLFIYPLICFQFPFLTCNRLLLSVLTVVLFLTNLSPAAFLPYRRELDSPEFFWLLTFFTHVRKNTYKRSWICSKLQHAPENIQHGYFSKIFSTLILWWNSTTVYGSWAIPSWSFMSLQFEIATVCFSQFSFKIHWHQK